MPSREVQIGKPIGKVILLIDDLLVKEKCADKGIKIFGVLGKVQLMILISLEFLEMVVSWNKYPDVTIWEECIRQ